MKIIDLRSDTVTKPTNEMMDSILTAQLGDDVYRDDLTTIELEEYAAELLGKDSALFVPSGTFGNQLSLLTWTNQGDEVIAGSHCHIVKYEVGAAALIAGVNISQVPSEDGILDIFETKARIRPDNIHFPKTSLICMENAHSSGNVVPLENMEQIFDLANSYNIPVHLDGARIFNAAVYLNEDVRKISQYAHSINICLSKGLCAPAGSLILGDKFFIEKARKYRKLMGGGMRQTGILAAPGLVALKVMRNRLHEDHLNAQYLGEKLSEIDDIDVDLKMIKINMVFFKLNILREDITLFEYLDERNIKINPLSNGYGRIVVHHGISRQDIDMTAEAIRSYIMN